VVKPASAAAVRTALSDGDGEYGHVAVLGTPATAKNGAYVREIAAICDTCEVLPVGCPMFVPLVENGYTAPDCAVTRLIATEYVSKLAALRPRSVILGCTHYPLIRASVELACEEVLGYRPAIVDSGACAANAISEMLREKSLLAPTDKKGESRFFVSDETHNFASSASAFLGREIGDVERIRI
jgi:glutamate racemase